MNGEYTAYLVSFGKYSKRAFTAYCNPNEIEQKSDGQQRWTFTLCADQPLYLRRKKLNFIVNITHPGGNTVSYVCVNYSWSKSRSMMRVALDLISNQPISIRDAAVASGLRVFQEV